MHCETKLLQFPLQNPFWDFLGKICWKNELNKKEMFLGRILSKKNEVWD